jgi:hypothetical protein
MFGIERKRGDNLGKKELYSDTFSEKLEELVIGGQDVYFSPDESEWVEIKEEGQIQISRRHDEEQPSHLETWQLEFEGDEAVGIRGVTALVFPTPSFLKGMTESNQGVVHSFELTLPRDSDLVSGKTMEIFTNRSLQGKAIAWLFGQFNIDVPDDAEFPFVDRERGLTLDRTRGSGLSVTFRRTGKDGDVGGYTETWLFDGDGLAKVDAWVNVVPPLFEGILPIDGRVSSFRHTLAREEIKGMTEYERGLFTDFLRQQEVFLKLQTF